MPAVVGVPEIVPDACRAVPAGNAPAAMLHEYGALPPDAANVAVYPLCTVPFGSVLVVTLRGVAG